MTGSKENREGNSGRCHVDESAVDDDILIEEFADC
jgi:hypothetical protein